MDDRPIGFFDSGLGGLTCIPYLMKALPDERIIYFGDTARTPYGSKAVHTIRNFAFEITDFLVREGVKMIVIACNTISATCIGDLRARHPGTPVLGIISPAARTIAAAGSAAGNIGVIGTKVTINSRAYITKINKFAPGMNISATACPIFVPLIEEGIIADDIMDLSIRRYLDPFIAENAIDTLVLGCTHYPLIKSNITRLYPKLSIVDPSKEVVRSIRDSLATADIFAANNNNSHTSPAPNEAIELESAPKGHIFYASDLSENFLNMINRIFQGSGFTVAFKNFDLENMIQ